MDKVKEKGIIPDLSQVLDSLPYAVVIVDQTGVIHYANLAAENVFNTSVSSLFKHGLKRILPVSSPVFEVVNQAFKSRSAVNEYQIDISTPKSGEGLIVDVYAATMGDDPHLGILVFRARSMADRIANQLSHRTAARSVTGLSAMLAHEIKNPLSGIRGAAQLLGGAVSDQDRELADLITSETDRIVKILDRMEVFSDETPVELEPVNMHSVLGQVRKIAENGFASKITFMENYDPSLPQISGSHDELIQVFLNLVKNAAEALNGTNNSRITLSSAYRPGIRIKSPGGKKLADLPLEFRVSDNGPGISDDIRSQIFEPFVTTRINGSGLGLALVAKTIGRHGGIIECLNNGNGTTFRILLPAWKSSGDEIMGTVND
ncbi:MAG: two-component system sensor histidine kinase NtrB [Rhizobiaceae bacterium]